MADENKQTFGPQPRQFGQDKGATTEKSALETMGALEGLTTEKPVQETNGVAEEPTGVENVRYNDATNQGMPDNPRNAREVVERGVVNVANPQTVGAQALVAPEPSEEEKERADAVAGIDHEIKTVDDWLAANPPETKEQREKRERREKSARIISAVSDGLSALSNLYFTSQYAPDMYDHEKSSQLTPLQAQLEKAKKEREANADKYLRLSLKRGALGNERAKTLRELKAQQERQKLAREKADREAEQHGWLAALQRGKQREQEGKADRAEQEAVTAEAEAKNAPAMQAAKLETERQRGKAQKASAANSYASAAAHNRSNVSEFYAWDSNGKRHPFRTKEAADAFARQHGTYQETETEETTTTNRTNERGKKSSSTSTKKKKTGVAGRPSPTGKPSPTA